jgi:hypothetical protein
MREKSINNIGHYDIATHQHIFACWAAGRASSVKGCRFEVSAAREWLEGIELRQYINAPDSLPDDFDAAHREWRNRLLQNARLPLTHGIAAKLINCYLKAAIICAGHHHHPKVAKIHPPIDRLLLNRLAKEYPDITLPKKGWSTFDEYQYEEVIKQVKSLCNDQPLWMIEKYWQGHQ